MKNIFYSFALLSLLFASCSPMEDIYAELDAQEKVISGEAIYTLTNADYSALKLTFGNFSNLDDAKLKLPAFLAGKYPAWGKESLAEVTFKLYSPKSTESSLEVYTVSDADYSAGGFTYGNFSSPSDIAGFLDSKYPNAANRLLVSLTYKYYSGSVSTLNNGFLRVNGAWEMASGITDAEYTAMGEGFANFSSTDEALTKIPVFLSDKFKYDGKATGDIVAIMYKYYSGSVKSKIANFIYNGSTWSVYSNVINETIKFGHDGTNWVPDNTIKYTLTPADYTLVGNGYYNNFDVRAGKVEEPETVRLEKVNTILKNNFPNDEEGQKYVVSYNIFNGANGIWSLAVIKVGSEFVKQ